MKQYHNNNNNNNNANNNNGGRTMTNNTIRNTRNAENAAKEAAKKAAEKAARLKRVKPMDTIGAAQAFMSEELRPYFAEDGTLMGVYGGDYIQEPIFMADGSVSTIAAETPEAMARLKEQLNQGLSGDGKYHATVIFEGMVTCCVGNSPEDLDKDIQAAEEMYESLKKGLLKNGMPIKGSVYETCKVGMELAELIDSGDLSDNIKEVIGKDNQRYLIVYDDNYIMALSGETKATLDDIQSPLTDKDKETILVDRLNAALSE